MTHSGRLRKFAECAARAAAMPGLARGRFAWRDAASPSRSLSVLAGSLLERSDPVVSGDSPLLTRPSAVPEDLPEPPSDPSDPSLPPLVLFLDGT